MGGDAEGDVFANLETFEYTTRPDRDGDAEDRTARLPDIEDLTGSGNDDILAGDFRDNTIRGGAGDDTLYGGPGGGDGTGADSNADTLHGDDGNDRLFGGVGDDELRGGVGNDHLWGGPGADMLYGGEGDDMIYADNEDLHSMGIIRGGDGNDTVSFEKETMPVEYTAANGIKNIIGTDADGGDTLTGDGSRNVIEGRDGGDVLHGGDGSDTVSYASSDRRVTVNLDAADGTPGVGVGGGHAAGDSIIGFENIIGSAYSDILTGNDRDNMLTGGAGNDDLTGGAGNDDLTGGAGNDELTGDAGDDTLEGGAGADKLDGGGGKNTLSYASSNAAVMVNLATASVSGGHAQGDEIMFDEMELGGRNVDVPRFHNITGSAHNDRLTGDHRSNVLEGGAGADRLDGGEASGENTGDMPSGNRAAPDTASYAGSKSGVTVDLTTGRGLAGDAEGDTLVNIEKFLGSSEGDTFLAGLGGQVIDGGGGSDTVSYENLELTESQMKTLDGDAIIMKLTNSGGLARIKESSTGVNGGKYSAGRDDFVGIENITGSSYNDEITGNNSENTLKGGAGNDKLDGGVGNDTLDGGAGDDTLGDDTLMGGDAGDDTLMGGAGDDKLMGGTGNDKLDGGAGDDTLMGGDGNDTLMGGEGDDTLTGDEGIDTFVFSPADGDGFDTDTITDFVKGTDKINLMAFFATELDFDDLDIAQRGTNTIIDLSDHGGGTIVLDDFNFMASNLNGDDFML